MATPEHGSGGKFTSLFKKEKSSTDENSGVDTSPVGAGPGAAAIGEARVEAAAGIETRRGRGRPRKESSAIPVAGKSGAAQPAKSNIPPEVAAQLEAMYSPEVWESVVDMPFAAAQLYTGHEHWGLEDKSRRVLSVSLSTAARYMGFTNPKWLAINLFLINLATITAPRVLKEIAIRRAEKLQSQKKNPAPPDATGGS